LRRFPVNLYEKFIQSELLAPLGIQRMRIGHTLINDRLSGEVLYHSGISEYDYAVGPSYSNAFNLRRNIMVEDKPSSVLNQYGGSMNYVNAAPFGGWIASAVDLVRFASELDNVNNSLILSFTSIKRLFDFHNFGSSNTNEHYGCGWWVKDPPDNYEGESHGGTVTGAKAMLARWRDKDANNITHYYTAALLFNKNDEGYTDGWKTLELIRDTANSVLSWPTDDFWDDYGLK